MRYRNEVVDAIIKEVEMEKDYLQGKDIETVYFGGGTPSLLNPGEFAGILKAIRNNFSVSDNAEITLEANPDDINLEKLRAWKDAGINRLSIGIQSFFEDELRWMNRAYNARQATDQLELARREFDNVTIDLIYGSPLLTDEMWKENVDRATGLDIPHLSCYALTVEEKTPLEKMIRTSKSENVDQDKQARQFLLLMHWLKEKGYEHYEVSNFAKPGFRSRHNSSYWKGKTYLGLGPSAHSYNGSERRWNIANNQLYIQGVKEKNPKRELELLTETQRLNEYIMISLRTAEGLNLDTITQYWGNTQMARIARQLGNYESDGLVRSNGPIVQLTDEGMLMADGIAANLFAGE